MELKSALKDELRLDPKLHKKHLEETSIDWDTLLTEADEKDGIIHL